jgi:hypothetical protein
MTILFARKGDIYNLISSYIGRLTGLGITIVGFLV